MPQLVIAILMVQILIFVIAMEVLVTAKVMLWVKIVLNVLKTTGIFLPARDVGNAAAM